jgi:hypothetical protein
VNTEDSVRTALREVAATQPPPPVDRVASVRRRHVRRRAMQVTAGMSAVALIGIGVAALPSIGHHRTHPAHLTNGRAAWQLGWPTLVDPSVHGEDAVATWAATLTDGQDADDAWLLYAGVPAGSSTRWAIFETAPVADDKLLITATAPADGGQWQINTLTAAPDPSSTHVIGADVDGRLVALTAPDVQNVRLIDLNDGSPPVVTKLSIDNRVATTDFNGVANAAALRADEDPGTFVVAYPAEQGDVAEPSWVTMPEHSDYGDAVITSAGGNGGGGHTSAGADGVMTAVVRCIGPADATADVNGTTRSIPACDGLDHAITFGPISAGAPVEFKVNGTGDFVAGLALYLQPASAEQRQAYTDAIGELRDYLDAWRQQGQAAASQHYLVPGQQVSSDDITLTNGTVESYAVQHWTSANEFILDVTLDMHFQGSGAAWNDGLNGRIVYFTRGASTQPWRMSFATGR